MPRAISISATWEAWNPEALYIMVRLANKRAAEHVVKEARRNLSAGGHNDTGKLGNSFVIHESRFGALGAEAEVSNEAPYARWVDEGVNHQIYPTQGNVLKFRPGKRKPKGALGRFVPVTAEYLYRPSVRGQAATYFFTNAVNSLSVFDFI